MNKISLDKLDQIVEAVFAKYDTNNNGLLEFHEIRKMLEESFQKTNRWRKVHEEDVKHLMEMVPFSKRNRIDRE